jgi:PAS domain S-box-containing protein
LAVVLFQLDDAQILEVSDSLASLFRASRAEMLGREVIDFLVDQAGARARWALMATRRLDGYHVLAREWRRLDGGEFIADSCVNVVGDTAHNRCAIGMLLPQSGGLTPAPDLADATGAVVLGTVSAEWHIDRVSAAVEQVLGYSPTDVVGESIATLVEPGDLPSLLAGVGRCLQAPGGSMIGIRMRTANGTHRHCRMLVTRLAGTEAEGLGFAFAITEQGAAPMVERTWELERVLQHLAWEIEATGVLAGLKEPSATTNLVALGGLSRREIEIVRRLMMGDRVQMIAQQLFVSESTVRNHLTSVYRKLGVRSQQQLLSLLRTGQP